MLRDLKDEQGKLTRKPGGEGSVAKRTTLREHHEPTDRPETNHCSVIPPTFLKLSHFHYIKQVTMLITFSKCNTIIFVKLLTQACHTIGVHHMVYPF